MAKNNIYEVAEKFLSFESMTHKKLQKLCYYAQAWHLALLNKPLFDDEIQAWIHGPVSPGLYHRYKEFGWRPIPEVNENDNNIPEESEELINEVMRVYGDLDGDELEMLTHEEEPWLEARGELDDLTPSHKEIEYKTMKEYYLKEYEELQSD